MNLQVTSDNIEISPSMKELAKSKVSKFERYFSDVPSDLSQIRVVLNSSTEGNFEVSVELSLGKMEFYGKSADHTLETALIAAVDDVERQYVKEKEKREEKDWDEAREMKRYPIDEQEV